LLSIHHVIDHGKPIAAQAAALGIGAPGFVFSTTHTADHLKEIVELIAPQGREAVATTVRLTQLIVSGRFSTKSQSWWTPARSARRLPSTSAPSMQRTSSARHGRDGIDHWLHGSIAEEVSRKAKVATLFIPPTARGFVDQDTGKVSLSRVLVPVDYSPPKDVLRRMLLGHVGSLQHRACKHRFPVYRHALSHQQCEFEWLVVNQGEPR
jgi:hypothetical protein